MEGEGIFEVHDKKHFEECVIKSSSPVVVSFLADNETCKKILPRVEQVLEENKGKISMAKIDVNECKDLSEEYGIKTAPVLEIYKDGSIFDSLPGLHDLDEIRSFVKNSIGN
ncbi:hypothetical protein PVAND_017487 [Polypedilum vanderplanki]|uniref:Thioredoxin n=1 Tax=Polypedilum vanderplanki TaxID=319348 RepID=C7G3K8_POLVA|nr:hypothetical protein PVAND_017487 [Polypedilum vanderplanki]BAH97746.1 thioredoxin2 [Polypedilum vanderplanki]BAN67619.1 thioredoxin [Polypedilum vanderplanki]